MRHLFCLVGLHQRREAAYLQFGNGLFHEGWVCDRRGCHARKVTPGEKVPEYDQAHPKVGQAVQSGIKAMRRESKI
jgi:hypothetical protein